MMSGSEGADKANSPSRQRRYVWLFLVRRAIHASVYYVNALSLPNE
jgi:hypothetical protein